MFLHRTELTSLRSELANNLLDVQVGRHHLSPYFTDEKIESQGDKWSPDLISVTTSLAPGSVSVFY